MSNTHSCNHHTIPPTHEDFRWVFGSGQNERFADFIELARDISAGVRTCLQIIYASELVREMNQDADPEQVCAPAIGKADANNLFRLALAAISALHQISQDKIDLLNKMEHR